MWNNYTKLPIQSPLLGRCEILPPCGYTTTLLEIPNKGHCQLSPELGMAHWIEVFFFCNLPHTGCIYLLWTPSYPRKIIFATIWVSFKGSNMLPCTDLLYPLHPCSSCNLHLHLASLQLLLLLFPSYSHPDRLWHWCAPSAEHCHQMFVTPCQQ